MAVAEAPPSNGVAVRESRSDAYPQWDSHPDNGCSVAPKCVECPLSMCRYEYPTGLRGLRNLDRDKGIREMFPLTSVTVIAAELGISERTVYRVAAA